MIQLGPNSIEIKAETAFIQHLCSHLQFLPIIFYVNVGIDYG